MAFEFHWSEEKHTFDFFTCLFCLLSLNMVSSVIDRMFKSMDELYKKVIFVHLLCAWMAAFLRLMFTVSINTLSSNGTLMVVLALLKYIEVVFRHLGMATNLVMVCMYAFAIYESSKGRTGLLERAPMALFGVYIFYGLYPIFHLGVEARLDVDRTYMLWTNTSSYKDVQKGVNGLLLVFWLLTQVAALVLTGLARFKYGCVMHHSPKLYRMYLSFFQLMVSFAIFNMPSAVASIVSNLSGISKGFEVTENLLGWKTLQGAIDSFLIYNLFFKQKDSAEQQNSYSQHK
jgi:hypothetical protein